MDRKKRAIEITGLQDSELPEVQVTVALPAEKPKPKAKKKKFNPARELYDWVQTATRAIAFFVTLFALAAVPYLVPGATMQEVLDNNEIVMARRLLYSPARGDMVVFRHDPAEIEEIFVEGREDTLVKRVIGLQGDVLRYDEESQAVLVNGELADESFLRFPMPADYAGNLIEGVTVPDGHVYLMGDFRELSIDSRNPEIGFVDTREIIGKVILRVYPLREMVYFGW